MNTNRWLPVQPIRYINSFYVSQLLRGDKIRHQQEHFVLSSTNVEPNQPNNPSIVSNVYLRTKCSRRSYCDSTKEEVRNESGRRLYRTLSLTLFDELGQMSPSSIGYPVSPSRDLADVPCRLEFVAPLFNSGSNSKNCVAFSRYVADLQLVEQLRRQQTSVNQIQQPV